MKTNYETKQATDIIVSIHVYNPEYETLCHRLKSIKARLTTGLSSRNLWMPTECQHMFDPIIIPQWVDRPALGAKVP